MRLISLADDDMAAAVRKITKADVLKFYEQHLSPKSITRAKISVHLITKKKPVESAKLTDDERLESLTSELVKQLTLADLPANQAQLKARFDGVDLASGNEETITSSITSYLKNDAKLPDEAVQKVLLQSKAQLTTLLTAVGVAPANTSKDDSGHEVVLQERTYITDMDKLKRDFPKYPFLRPVKDLSEFIDPELKL